MTTTQVFRLEYNGGGVYSSGALSECDIGGNEGAHIHPAPWKDKALGWHDLSFMERALYYFGFESISALHAWFYSPAWREDLSEHGVVLKVYIVPVEYAVHGEKQSIFVMNSALGSEVVDQSVWV